MSKFKKLKPKTTLKMENFQTLCSRADWLLLLMCSQSERAMARASINLLKIELCAKKSTFLDNCFIENLLKDPLKWKRPNIESDNQPLIANIQKKHMKHEIK